MNGKRCERALTNFLLRVLLAIVVLDHEVVRAWYGLGWLNVDQAEVADVIHSSVESTHGQRHGLHE